MKKKELMKRLSAISMAAMMTVTMIPSNAYAADELFSDIEVETSADAGDEDSADVAVSDADDTSDADIEVEEAEDDSADVNVEEDEEDDSESVDAFSDGTDSTDETDAFDAGEGEVTPAEDAVIHMTVSVAGEFAKDKDGALMVDRDVTVKDIDKNGILTCDEALIAAHDEYYNGGAIAGYATADGTYGKYISKFWGDASGAFGYWLNDNSCMGLSDEVKADDYFSAFVYKDKKDFSDAYVKFDQKSFAVEATLPFTAGLQKAEWNNDANKYVYKDFDGAKLTVYDSSFKALSEDAYTVDGDSFTFAEGGTYYLVASGTDSVNVVPTAAKVEVKGEVIIPATSIKVSRETLNVQAGDYELLSATVEPKDTTQETVWTSSDESIATVVRGRVTGVKVGKATITATAGDQSASCEVTVTAPPQFSSIKLYRSEQDYKDGKDPVELTPEFSRDQHTYDLKEPIADYDSLYAEATLAPEFKDTVNRFMFSADWANSWRPVSPVDGVGAEKVSYPSGYAAFYSGASTDDTLYQVNIKAYATLSSLSVDGRMDQAFDKDVTSYHAYVDKNAEGVTVKAQGKDTKYTLKVNGEVVKANTNYTVPYNWDKKGKMKIEVVVGGAGKVDHTYTIEAEPYPEKDTPEFVSQPKSANYIIGDTTSKLSFVATCTGKLAYQWYSNTEDNNTTGTVIEGATEAAYQPSAEKEGTTYYYCVITNTEQTENNKATTDTACITVDPNPMPEAVFANPGEELGEEYPWNYGYTYWKGRKATELSVNVTTPVEGGTLSYTWVRNDAIDDLSGIIPSTEVTCTPETDKPNETGYFYHCKVTYTYKGKKYSTYAKTGKKYTDKNGEEKDATAVFVYVKLRSMTTPDIRTQPKDAVYTQGDIPNSIYVYANISETYAHQTYQWYVNDKESYEGATTVKDNTSANSSYFNTDTNEPGTRYYFCVVTASLQGKSSSAISRICKFVVNPVDDYIGTLLKGKGTQEDPYLISTAEDYQAVSDLVAKGISFNERYLKQTNNITLPRGWKPIGTSKKKLFAGYLDGNGKTVSIPSGELPLLGYIKGAEVHNLKIYGKKIAGYGLVNNFEGVGFNGSAIIIDNVTLKSGSSTLKSGLIGANITENSFAGTSAGFVATIRNCTIESGVVVGYDKDQTIIGGIAGRMQGVIENCVSHATVYGKSYVGGIVGSRDNAMGDSNVYSCTFDGTVVASGDHAGGIVGGGYNDSSAPNGGKFCINGCKSSGTITGSDKVGGILGADTYVLQTWENVKNTVKGNSFTGKVQATADGAKYIGGIIGYYGSLDKWDDVANNYYAKDCGAEKGIGFVANVDTSCTTHETESGAAYVTTGTYSRTDDPLGADAAKLANTEGVQVYIEDLKLSGECRDTFYLGEELNLDGLSIKAVYSDGTSKDLNWKDLEIEGFDNTVKGEQTLTLNYDGATASKTIKVLAAPDSDPIHVSFTLLGDTKHGADTEECHTLDGENLTTWVETGMIEVGANETVYEVIKSLEEKYGFKIYDRETQYGTYIYAVEYKDVTLSEFDNGQNSGWMDTINDVHPGVGVAKQYLNDGDVIVLHYTDDYTKEDQIPVAVKSTKRALTNLPETADLTLDNKAAVEAARKAYDALTDEQKEMIPEELVKKLEAAEARMKELHVHSWDEGKVTKEATCKEEGMKLYTCTECGETKTEVIPKTDHKYTWKVVSKATVFAPEKQQGTCSVCGAVVNRDNGKKLTATIKLNATSIKLQKKQTTKKIRVAMANGDSVRSWRSSNKKIATVNSKGVIKAGKKTGTAKITVTLMSGKKATLKVKVQTSRVRTTKISGLKKNVRLKKGQKLTLRPVLSPLTSQEKVTYTSSNKKVATVSKKGVITAKKKGTVKITVKSGKKSYVIKVKVK